MPRLSAFRIVVAGTAMVAGATFSPAAARAQGDATALTPLKSRTSDAGIARDYRVLTALQERLLAARRNRPTLPQYPFEKAQRWLSLARESYELNSPGTLPNDALGVAATLTAQLEAGATPPLDAGTQPPAYAAPVRADLRKLADSLRNSGQSERFAPELASVDVSLVRAALAQAKALLCAGENPEREAERSAMRAAALFVRQTPLAAAPPPRVDTVYVDRGVRPVAPPTIVRTTPRTLAGVPPNVHFALRADTLSPASKRVLDAAADSLLRYATVGVSLSGNTDSRGSAATNEALSRRRATRVRDYLVGKGVEATRITVQALGLTNLKTPETGVVDLARNRRVDITYISGDGHVIETREGLDDLQVEAAARPRPVAKPKKKP